jgi:hypothetical protein
MSKTLTKPSQLSLMDLAPTKPLTHGESMVLNGEITHEQLAEINRVGKETVSFFNNYFDRNK